MHSGGVALIGVMPSFVIAIVRVVPAPVFACFVNTGTSASVSSHLFAGRRDAIFLLLCYPMFSRQIAAEMSAVFEHRLIAAVLFSPSTNSMYC